MNSSLLFLRPTPLPMVEVFCSTAQCGELLGRAGPSLLEKKRGIPVWHIQPGWTFINKPFGSERSGILERVDQDFRSERQLLHETLGRQRPIEGMGLARECDLPVNVRCPKCRRVQFVVANQVRHREPPGRR